MCTTLAPPLLPDVIATGGGRGLIFTLARVACARVHLPSRDETWEGPLALYYVHVLVAAQSALFKRRSYICCCTTRLTPDPAVTGPLSTRAIERQVDFSQRRSTKLAAGYGSGNRSLRLSREVCQPGSTYLSHYARAGQHYQFFDAHIPMTSSTRTQRCISRALPAHSAILLLLG